MESMLETIDLDMEESNELLFKVKVEGADPAPAKVRLICESGDVSYMFNGRSADGDGLIQFILPVMKDKLKEGVYLSRVEVLIENRYFAPVQFQVNFKKVVRVVAESMNIPSRKNVPNISVSAVPVVRQSPVKQEPIKLTAQIDDPKLVPLNVERKAPIPAKLSAQMTLKERYHSKKDEPTSDIEELNEEVILKAAKSFVKDRRRK